MTAFIFPPRPKGKIDPRHLPRYEADPRWVAQRKFNGQRTGIHYVDGRITLYNRQGTAHGNYITPKFIIDEIASLNIPKGVEYWLDGELLDNKTKTPQYKNKIIIFDVLFFGKPLFQKQTLAERTEMIASFCRHPTVKEPHAGIALQVTANIWMAETFAVNLKERFKELNHLDEIEGLVLKRWDSKIDDMGHQEYETNWLIRCRKPHSGGLYQY